MTESASALCTRNALSSAMAPGSSARAEPAAWPRAASALSAAVPWIESDHRAECAPAAPERKPKSRHLRRRASSVPVNLVSAREIGGRERRCRCGSPASRRPRPPIHRGRRPTPARGLAHGRLRRRPDHPVGHRQPVGHEGDDLLAHPLGIEARVDRPDHLDERSTRASRRLRAVWNRPEPVGQIRTDLRHPLTARRTTGARLPTSPRQSTLRPIWNGESF